MPEAAKEPTETAGPEFPWAKQEIRIAQYPNGALSLACRLPGSKEWVTYKIKCLPGLDDVLDRLLSVWSTGPPDPNHVYYSYYPSGPPLQLEANHQQPPIQVFDSAPG